MNASGIALIALALVAVLLVVVLAVVSRRRKRTTDLRGTFGSEYDRTLDRKNKRRDAERELAERSHS